MLRGMSSPIFMLGMHRSGTTLLARLLREMGVWTGAVRDVNEETSLAIHANEQLLHVQGASWDNPLSFQLAMHDSRHSNDAAALLDKILAIRPLLREFTGAQTCAHLTHFKPSQPWGLKDPRLTITLPVWLEHFPQARIISIRRHGIDVAASLHTRQQRVVRHWQHQYGLQHVPLTTRFATGLVQHSLRLLSLDECVQLWVEYCEQENRLLDSRADVLRLCYEELLHYPHTVLPHLAAYVGAEPKGYESLLQPQQALKYQQQPELMALAHRHAETLARFGYTP